MAHRTKQKYNSKLQGESILRTIFVLLFCFLVSFNAFGQIEPNSDEQVGVKEIYLARDDGNGKAGDRAESFLTTDIPIYCIVELNSSKSVTVKMNFVAVKTADWKPETNVATVSYKTNGAQDGVTFNAAPQSRWSPGSYRVDISINGKLAKSQSFEIQKSTQEQENKSKSAPKGKRLRGGRKIKS